MLTAAIYTLLGFIPYFAIVGFILALAWAATKLSPAFDEFMNRPDEPKLTEADYELMYDARITDPRH